MATSAVVSQATTISIKHPTTGSTYVKLPELKDFSGIGSGSASIIDATHLDSTAKEKLLGVVDEGTYKLVFNYIASNAAVLALQDRRNTSTLASFQIVLGATKKQLAFDAWVLTAEIGGGVDKLLELNVTLEVTGSVTVTTLP